MLSGEPGNRGCFLISAISSVVGAWRSLRSASACLTQRRRVSAEVIPELAGYLADLAAPLTVRWYSHLVLGPFRWCKLSRFAWS